MTPLNGCFGLSSLSRLYGGGEARALVVVCVEQTAFRLPHFIEHAVRVGNGEHGVHVRIEQQDLDSHLVVQVLADLHHQPAPDRFR